MDDYKRLFQQTADGSIAEIMACFLRIAEFRLRITCSSNLTIAYCLLLPTNNHRLPALDHHSRLRYRFAGQAGITHFSSNDLQ